MTHFHDQNQFIAEARRLALALSIEVGSGKKVLAIEYTIYSPDADDEQRRAMIEYEYLPSRDTEQATFDELKQSTDRLWKELTESEQKFEAIEQRIAERAALTEKRKKCKNK